MIQAAMMFALGFSVCGLIALALYSALSRRTRRLAEARVKRRFATKRQEFETERDDDELSEEDKLTVRRARRIQRFLSQPFFVAEVFTGRPGKYVRIQDTVKGFKEIVEGKHDDLPEQAFYMVGTLEEALEKAKQLAA